MLSEEKGGSRPIEIDTQDAIYPVLFAEDGKQILSGGREGKLRRWKVASGHEVGEPIQIKRAELFSIALSPDRKWFACGLRLLSPTKGRPNAGVWNAQTYEKVLDIKTHTDTVFSVDISPDSTKLATGGFDQCAFICDITTGGTLVGPLQHDGVVVGVRFSPTCDRIATATAPNPETNSIRIYNSEDGQLLFDIPYQISRNASSQLAWTADGRQLFAAAYGEVKCFDTSSGSLVGEWSVPGGGRSASIVLSRNQKFAVVVAYKTVSFWDASTQQQIGTTIEHASTVWGVALTPDDDCIATGEENGKIILRSLRGILPTSYITVNVTSQFPLMCISDVAFKSWAQGDLTRVEQLFTEEMAHPLIPFHHAHALALRALVRARSKQWDMASDDAKQSIKLHQSAIGYIAHAIAQVHDGKYELALYQFDLVFSVCLPTENNFLLLIKAIILFQCGRHNDAMLRVDDLIDIVDDQSQYRTVRAHMLLLLGVMSMKKGDHNGAIELLERAQEAIPFQQGPHLIVVSLIFGWDFDRLAASIQVQLFKAKSAGGHAQKSKSLSTVMENLTEEVVMSDTTTGWDLGLVRRCLIMCENDGDAAVDVNDLNGAVAQYTIALALNPSDPVGLLVKRSNVRAMLGLWEDSLKDADDAIKANPSDPWGYERRHSALFALQRYDEAISAFSHMHSLVERSLDQDICQLGKRYVSPAQSGAAINNIINKIVKKCPFVLIDVESGCLCDIQERIRTFKSALEFKRLLSSMTERIDSERIWAVVGRYFEYVTLSHVWREREPLFRDVWLAGSVWKLESSPLNDKLRKFCEVVRTEGFRWAWSDTCCIDRTIDSVLNQSLMMMYNWYEASAATFILLASVGFPSVLGDLTDSPWMTRAWTAQELLASKVIRFYTRDWKPYLDDTRSNHKESPEIMQELADAMGISREIITTFNPGSLSVREKLRLASLRNATVEEDMAYSLIGIFESDIIPHYGERDDALGHLLEEIVARSGEVTALAWSGKSSSYNSCLPASLAVYSLLPGTPAAIDEAEMDMRVASLRESVTRTDGMLIYDRITRLPHVRFANRRLYLPCIIFAVGRLAIRDCETEEENCYRARVSGIGHVEFQTSDKLSTAEPRKLIFIHPWIRDLGIPFGSFMWDNAADDDEYDSDEDTEPGYALISPSESRVVSAARVDDFTRALRLIVRLQQPFHALLLQQQANGEFKRVASEHEIVVPGLESKVNIVRDIRAEVVEIL